MTGPHSSRTPSCEHRMVRASISLASTSAGVMARVAGAGRLVAATSPSPNITAPNTSCLMPEMVARGEVLG